MIKRGNCTDFAPLLVLDYKTGVGTRTCLKFFSLEVVWGIDAITDYCVG